MKTFFPTMKAREMDLPTLLMELAKAQEVIRLEAETFAMDLVIREPDEAAELLKEVILSRYLREAAREAKCMLKEEKKKAKS